MTTADPTDLFRDAVVWDGPDSDHPARQVARTSYGLVASKQKDEWLDLFAEDALVEDPVGPSFFDPEGRGHRGRDAIGAFWDLAIAPVAKFRFHVHDSFVGGNACANVATFTTQLSDGTIMDTDLAAVYTVDEDGLITSMRAHWEMERSMATARKPDSASSE